MESLAQSNIFFIITSIAVVLVTLLLLIILWYLLRTIRNVFFVSKKIKEGTLASEKKIKSFLKFFK